MARDFTIPFATTGDMSDIPDTLQPDGSVSMTQGFGFDYERDNTDPAYKPVPREGFNRLFHDITEAVGLIQSQGAADWSVQFAPYRINSEVRHSDKLWRSLIANNNEEPGVGANWVGSESGVTAPQFDNSNKYATTAFVQRSLGSMAGVRVLSAGASLTAADVGHVIIANIAAGGVINLPSFSSLYAGARFYIQCGASSGAITVNAPAGMSFGAPNASGSPTTITIRPGVAQDFIYISSATVLVTNGAGIAQLGTSGYELSANGKILQWVRVSSTGVTPNVFQTITLPLTAPNGVLCAFGSNCSVSQSDTFSVNIIENTNSTVRISWSATNGGAAGARIFIVCH
ncbi:Phage tail fiber protein [Pseudomonas chlororaphis subsp. aureofaciens]|uniref:gp53-like domain-containing protein n=1 Tax=Pseudomonas chlororaphis TaxID=587753 RepID=UPI000F6CBA9E|nr:Phage tail fiber protein [Pseudomonas chlororaphis subsp. aureofaciens]